MTRTLAAVSAGSFTPSLGGAMSLYDYRVSLAIAAEDYPFSALIMAAMRRADADNLDRLQQAFPHTWAELLARYHAPGGFLSWEEAAVARSRPNGSSPY